MKIQHAIDLIHNALIYKPGWKFTATDHSKRFAETICVKVEYPAQNSDERVARCGYQETIDPVARASFPIYVGEFDSDDQLWRAIADVIMETEEHEMREFLRVKPSYRAPFHPHNMDGIKRWHESDTNTKVSLRNLRSDHMFGLA